MKSSLYVFTALAAGLAASIAAAQNAPPGIQEVIVTARKQAESLQDVPLSVLPISGEALQKARIASITDIANAVPGLQYNIGTASDAEIFLRGIGSDIQSAGADRAIGIFVDGVYMSRATGTAIDLYDLDRVEVLRGPQSLLFGKNVVGGLIHYVTRKPGEEPRVTFEGTVGNYDALEVKGSASGPIADGVYAGISASSRQHNGFADITGGAANGGDEEDLNSTAVRGQLRLKPNDSLDVLFAADYTRRRDGSRWVDTVIAGDSEAVTYNRFFAPPIAGLPGFVLPNRNSAFKNPDPRSGPRNFEGFADTRLWGLSGTVEWQQDSMTLTSITAVRHGEISTRESGDGYFWNFPTDPVNGLPIVTAPVAGSDAVPQDAIDYLRQVPDDYFDNSKSDKVKQISQELTLASRGDNAWNWRAGAYFLQEDIDRDEVVNFIFPDFDTITEYAFAIAFGGPPANPMGGTSIGITQTKAKNYGLFGEVGYDFANNWSLDVGLRYASDQKDLTVTRGGTPYDGDFVNGPFTAKADESWSELLPSLSLSWKPLDSSTYYFHYARGYKAGGWNGENATAADLASVSFAPELADNFEIGGKFNALDGRLRANVAVYFSKYEDLQIQQFLLVDPMFPPQNIITNSKGTEAKGLELDVQARPADWLDLGLNYAYTDCEFTKSVIVDSNNTDIKGNKCRRAPENAFNVSAEVHGNTATGMGWFARADYNWTDEYFFNNVNDPFTKNDAESSVNAAIGLTFADEKLGVTVWGRNLTDELNNSTLFDLFGTLYANYQPPRTFGVTVSWKQ
ncbi:MAG TPA: TonB-dependent receptor [Steroidobacteraceae bacterium]|nr:TonB-dependent receptor [Steroidobacteraceae bacterium]HRX88275.1 TonB-dependent receptor [Steroidobacteraceae bacterium]